VRHRGRTLGIEVDCVGLVLMAGLEAGVLGEVTPSLPVASGYGLLPNPRSMRQALEAHMIRVAVPRDGDVGFFDITGRGNPIHLGIFASLRDRQTIIHADAGNRRHCVVEIGFSTLWSARLDSAWRYPGLA